MVMADEDDSQDLDADVPTPDAEVPTPDAEVPTPDADDEAPAPASAEDKIEAAYNISIDIIAVLGTASMKVSQILKLGRGAVVELDRRVGDSIELRAENQLVARGEVVVIEDKLGITITEVIKR